MAVVVNALVLTGGLVLVVGAYRRWSWLVDPPLAWAPYYSQAALKNLFDTRFVVIFSYVIGLLMIATPLLAARPQ